MGKKQHLTTTKSPQKQIHITTVSSIKDPVAHFGFKKTTTPVSKKRQFDVNKIDLDDQQTLALNELLLQLAEVKRTLSRVSRENSGLRSEVAGLRAENSRLTRDTLGLVESIRSVTNIQHVILDEVNKFSPQSHLSHSTTARPLQHQVSSSLNTRLQNLETRVNFNSEILSNEVVQFSCPARSTRLGVELCSLMSGGSASPQSPSLSQQFLRPSTGYGSPQQNYYSPQPQNSYSPPSSSYNPSVVQRPASNGYSPPTSTGGGGQGGGGVFRPGGEGGGGGGGTFSGGRDVMDVIERGVSDAFCASAKSFNRRGAKILFDETLFEKGKMFSLADGDFEIPKSGFYNFQITYNTELCGALSLCGPTTVRMRKNSQTIRTISRSVASDSTRDLDFVSAVFLVDASRNDKIDLFLADFSGNGVTDVMFCGFFVGS